MSLTVKVKETGELFEATTQSDADLGNSRDATHELIRGKSYDGYLYVDAAEVTGAEGSRTFIYTERKWVRFMAEELDIFSVLPICLKQRPFVHAEIG